MKNAVLVAIIIVAALLVGLFAGRFLREGGDKKDVIVNIDKIKEIAQLATIEYHMTVDEHVHKKHKWYEWKNAELLVILHGVVRGLVDLEKIEMKKPSDDLITIRIPANAINLTNPEFGPNDIKAITISDPNVFNKLSDTDRNEAIEHGIADLKEKAIEAGIKEKTLDEAKKVIASYLAILGFEVEFTSDS